MPTPAITPSNSQAAQPIIKIRVENPDGVEIHIQADIDSPERARISRRFDFPTEAGQPEIMETATPGARVSVKKVTTTSEPNPVSPRIDFSAPVKSFAATLGGVFSRAETRLSPYFGNSANLLFALSIIIYLLVRLIGLTDYPSYFTFDEVNPTLLASDFIRDGFRNYSGEFFPAFFPNIDKYSLGTTVYIQLVPLLLFGQSAFAVRATSVLVGLIGAIGVSLALRDVFRIRYWWAGMLVLSLLPAWFHHSRIAYETVTFTSLYGGMLYFHLLYRNKSPSYLYVTILMEALAFYAYAPGQLLIPMTILVLIFSDIRYHWEERATVLRGIGLGILVALPYVRFRINHPVDTSVYLNNLQSYWVADIPLQEKLITFASRYFFYLSPGYWFTPETDVTAADGLLHLMKGYGHLPLYALPFLTWGLVIAFRKFRSSPYRTVLAALFVAPVSASIVLSLSSITHLLLMVIPVALLTTIGLDDLLQKLQNRLNVRNLSVWAATLFIILAGINTATLHDVLTNGTHWFDNNGAAGSQFGATKIFPVIQEELRTSPGMPIIISPNWTTMGDLVSRFFLGNGNNLRIQSIYDFATRKLPLEDNAIFVLTSDEYEFAHQNPKFSDIRIVKTIPYSPTKIGFYLVHLKYSPESDQIIAAEEAERRKPVTKQTTINGQPVTITHPKSGNSVDNVFDNNPDTLFKSDGANPAIFDLIFDKPREFKSFFIIHGSSPIEMIVSFYAENGDQLSSQSTTFTENGTQGNRFSLRQPVTAKRMQISVKDLSQGEPGFVHIWDIRLE
jgi:4-amino-4-deoxy-L-arabinose transferase-like glycosyltransferase